MCLQTELSTELYEAKNLVFNLLNRTLVRSMVKTQRSTSQQSVMQDSDYI